MDISPEDIQKLEEFKNLARDYNLDLDGLYLVFEQMIDDLSSREIKGKYFLTCEVGNATCDLISDNEEFKVYTYKEIVDLLNVLNDEVKYLKAQYDMVNDFNNCLVKVLLHNNIKLDEYLLKKPQMKWGHYEVTD